MKNQCIKKPGEGWGGAQFSKLSYFYLNDFYIKRRYPFMVSVGMECHKFYRLFCHKMLLLCKKFKKKFLYCWSLVGGFCGRW